MLIEMAAADAYAVAWEFTEEQAGANDLSAFHRHPTHLELVPGRYTDDTQRAVANAKVVLSGEDDWFSPAAYVAAYQAETATDPRPGWSRGFGEYLADNRAASPASFMRRLRRRATNGCLMGVAPLGYLPDVHAVKTAATMQTVATHAGAAVPLAQCIALAAHFFVADIAPRSRLREWLRQTVEWDGSSDRTYVLTGMRRDPPKARMPARTVAAAALWAVTNLDSQSEILKWAVAHGDDTDSLAAVAVSIASACPAIASDLPDALVGTVETPDRRGVLRQMDADLTGLWR